VKSCLQQLGKKGKIFPPLARRQILPNAGQRKKRGKAHMGPPRFLRCVVPSDLVGAV